jgi:hypothetical protein
MVLIMMMKNNHNHQGMNMQVMKNIPMETKFLINRSYKNKDKAKLMLKKPLRIFR